MLVYQRVSQWNTTGWFSQEKNHFIPNDLASIAASRRGGNWRGSATSRRRLATWNHGIFLVGSGNSWVQWQLGKLWETISFADWWQLGKLSVFFKKKLMTTGETNETMGFAWVLIDYYHYTMLSHYKLLIHPVNQKAIVWFVNHWETTGFSRL